MDRSATISDLCLGFAPMAVENGDSQERLDVEGILGLKNLLIRERKLRGWTQRDTCAWFGVDQGTYSRWEKGPPGGNYPHDDLIPKVAEFLRVPELRVRELKAGLGRTSLTRDEQARLYDQLRRDLDGVMDDQAAVRALVLRLADYVERIMQTLGVQPEFTSEAPPRRPARGD